MVLAYTDASGNESIVTPGNPLPVSAGGASSATDPVKVNGTLGALNATIAIVIGQRDTMSMHVLGTFVGTIVLQGSGDGTNWVTLNGATQWQNIATNTNVGSITAAGLYQTTVSALPYVRVLMSAYTSGSASIYLEAVDGNAAVFLDSPLPAGSNLIGNVGLQNSAFKAASTAPAAADQSLVVTQSPNYAAAALNVATTHGATTSATSVKTSAGSIFELALFNGTASTVYFKLYAKASAPTVGTDVPIMTIPVAAGAPFFQEFGQYGKRVSTGIAYALTGAAADSDATAPAAGFKVTGTYL